MDRTIIHSGECVHIYSLGNCKNVQQVSLDKHTQCYVIQCSAIYLQQGLNSFGTIRGSNHYTFGRMDPTHNQTRMEPCTVFFSRSFVRSLFVSFLPERKKESSFVVKRFATYLDLHSSNSKRKNRHQRARVRCHL